MIDWANFHGTFQVTSKSKTNNWSAAVARLPYTKYENKKKEIPMHALERSAYYDKKNSTEMTQMKLW